MESLTRTPNSMVTLAPMETLGPIFAEGEMIAEGSMKQGSIISAERREEKVGEGWVGAMVGDLFRRREGLVVL